MSKKRNPWDDRFWQAHPAFTRLPEEEEVSLRKDILVIVGALIVGFILGAAYGVWFL